MAVNRGFLPNSADATPLAAGKILSWYDFADLSTLITNSPSENRISYVMDKGPFNMLLETDSSTGTAIEVAAFPSVGRTCAKGNGSNFFVDGSSINVASPVSQFTCFCVFSDNGGTLFNYDGGGIVASTSSVVVNGNSVAAPAELSDDDAHIMMLQWDYVSGDVVIKFDEQDSAVINNETSRFSAGFTGIELVSGTVLFGEFIMFSDFLQALQVNRVGNYLCRKWGLTWSDVS
jgi:hypothetical protein